MHILLIPSWYPTIQNPITGLFMREQALALQKAKHRIGVLVSPILRSKKHLPQVRSLADLCPITSVESDMGIATYRTIQWGWFPSFMAWGNRHLVLKSGLQMFQRYLAEVGRPDIIHAHNIINGGYLAACIQESWQIPYVLTEHSSRFLRNLIRNDEDKIIRLVLQQAARIMSVSNAVATALHNYIPHAKIEVIGNMLDDEFFVPANHPVEPLPFTFILIASLLPVKGIDILLKAFALAFRDRAVRLSIGGDGPLRAALEQKTQELGITKQVSFFGKLSREGVRDAICNSHVLVSASYKETFGVTLIEAMACGKPVIATRSGGPESFICESNGLLVQPGNPKVLAHAMQRMIKTYDVYDPDAIRTECVTRFGETAYVQRLNAIYRQSLSMMEAQYVSKT